jgi:hypothetical protein
MTSFKRVFQRLQTIKGGNKLSKGKMETKVNLERPTRLDKAKSPSQDEL